MRITALPFLSGSCIYGLFTGNWEFTIAACIILGVLVLTKQLDLF